MKLLRLAWLCALAALLVGAATRAADTSAPSVPQAVRALELNTTNALVSWLPATDDTGVARYDVYRDSVFVGSSATTNFTDVGPLDIYRSYEYTVAAFDAAGNGSALSSAAVFAYHRFGFTMPWLDPRSSSVTDLRGWSPGPASTFVTASNGHLYAGLDRIRFFGVNAVFSGDFPPHDVAEKMAARLARLGVNCVRFHHMDTQNSPSGIFMNVSSADPRYRRTLDPTQLDRMDYYIAQLKQRGVYVNLNLHVGRVYPGFPTNGVSTSYFKGIDNFMPGMIDLQKEYARDLLGHVNPYTGLAYTNDPVVALIEINNENGLIHEWQGGLFGPDLHTNYPNELTAQWNAWLAARYTNTLALSNAWAPAAGSSYGREFLTNGTFSTGLVSPWTLQLSNGAAATSLILTGAAPGAVNAVELNVTAAGTNANGVQWLQGGLALTATQLCTVTFWARAAAPRTGSVMIAQNHSPWAPLASAPITLNTNWEQHTLVIMPTNTDSNARLALAGLAASTGRVQLANISFKTGNTLLGPSQSWAEGGTAPEMLLNGNFAAGFGSPWTLQIISPASATRGVITNGAPGPANALEINIVTNDTTTWHVQMYQAGLRLTNGQAYTLRFAARAEEARPLDLNIMQAGDPYATRGSASVVLDTNWQNYTVVMTSSGDESNARVTLGGMAGVTGRLWLASISLQASSPALGLGINETLGSASIIGSRSDLGMRSRGVQRDWMQFLWNTERSYWTGMRDYLKNTLGCRALIIGTQSSYSPTALQAEMDVVDSHAYWNHPSFPGTPWDPDNWTIGNKTMTGLKSGTTLTGPAAGRIAGKPFVCTEYNHPAPNTYCSEAFPVLATYAAFQDWDGVFPFDYLGSTNLSQSYFSGFFDMGREGSKLVTFPFSAAVLRRGAVAGALNQSLATVPLDMAITRVAQTDVNLGASDFGIDSAVMFSQGLALALGTGSMAYARGAIRDSNQLAYASDTGQLTWDTANGVLTVRAPAAKAVIGHANQRTYDLGHGVTVTPGQTMQGTNWAAITLLVQDGTGFGSGSNRILITALGYVDNHRMTWKTNMGPTDSPSSVGTQWGKAPTLLEGVPATITFPAPASQVTVWALDGRGDRKTQLPVSGTAQATFTLDRTYESPWYEVAIGYHVPPSIQITNLADGATIYGPTNIAVMADAVAPDNDLSRVEFYSGASKLGQSVAPPYTFVLTNPAPGPVTVAVMAVDTQAQTASDSVSLNILISAPNTFVPAGAAWRYRDDGANLGAGWRSNSYSDAAWSSGRARLGFGGDGEITPLKQTNTSGATNITFYFRSSFYVPNAALVQTLSARMTRDDGAIVYLNGAEIWRDNMPAGTVSSATLASANVTGTSETNWYAKTLGVSNLVTGWNLLAAEVHQSTNTSSDVGFNFELAGTALIQQSPALAWGVTGTNTEITWPANLGLFTLSSATNLAAPVVWTTVTNTPVLSNGAWHLTLPARTNRQTYYRLAP